MPTDDVRLEHALRDAAPAVDPTGVLERVTHKRARRRRTRRLGAVTAALVVLVAGTTTVLVARDDGSSPNIAAPATGPSAHVVTGDDARANGDAAVSAPIALDGAPGPLRGPLTVGTTSLSIASDDRGASGPTPSHVVEVQGTRVVGVVDFKAEVISFSTGEGTRWAVTRNPPGPAGTVPSAFLKRIGADGIPVSTEMPPGADPVGPVAAVGGAVWVPVRDGVDQFDAADGRFVRHLPLPPADSRWISLVGTDPFVTDGGALQELDAFAGLGTKRVEFGPGLLGLASRDGDGRVLLRNERGGVDAASVARADGADPVRIEAVLPRGFHPDALAASAERFWVTGSVDDRPAIVLLGDAGVRATVVVDGASTAALAWTGAHTVSAVTDGRLFEVRVP